MEKQLSRQRLWQIANRDRYNEYRRKYMKKYRQTERYKKKQREYMSRYKQKLIEGQLNASKEV